MEHIWKALEVFFNKHLTATILSIVITLIINLFLPNDYWMINKLGLNIFRVFIFCLCFTLIKFIVWLVNKIKAIFVRCNRKKENKRKEIQEEEENVQEWRNAVDNMSYQDREAIMKLIKTKNIPIQNVNFSFYDYNSIYKTQLVHKTKDKNGIEMVKLTDEGYEMFSYIYEKYGTIGNFK